MKSPAKNKEIYLDHASATPIDPVVFEAVRESMELAFANPGAVHELGLEAKEILEASRRGVAEVLGAHTDEIIFTSGATESNNLAIAGVVASYREKSLPHIVTTNIEHASVLETCRMLERTKQAHVTYVPVEPTGIVDPKKIKKALRPDTVLVSVMYANNEIGTVQPVREIAKEIRHYRKHKKKDQGYPLFHTDAVQAANYLPLAVEKLGIDLLSLNGAKIYGSKSVGVLFVKRRTPIARIMEGGDQENKLRPGTENIALAVGMALALRSMESMKEKETKRLTALRDYFFKKLIALSPRIIANGDRENRLPNNVNITVSKIPSDLLIIELSARGIYASAKSACKSGDGKASHVIEAIRPGTSETDGSLRFSLGRVTTKADIDAAVRAMSAILAKLDRWYT